MAGRGGGLSHPLTPRAPAQVLSPAYVWPFLFVVGLCPAGRRVLTRRGATEEGFKDAVRGAWSDLVVRARGRRSPPRATERSRAAGGTQRNRCEGLWTVFGYRLMLNARAIGLFFITIQYNLDKAYLDMQLSRAILSWVATVLLCAAPSTVDMSREERARTLSPANIVAKLVGSAILVGAIAAHA